MRILIADDENLSREMIKNLLSHLPFSIEIISEVSDGLTLIQEAQITKPDLAFIDIQMPELDGLSSIREVRELTPKTQWVIISSYSDFEYTSQAIDLNVIGYLLKPISPKDMEKIIAKAFSNKNNICIRENREFESIMSKIMNDYDYNCASLLENNYRSLYYSVDVISVTSNLPSELKNSMLKELSNTIRNILDNYVDTNFYSSLAILQNGEIAVIVAWKDKNQFDIIQQLHCHLEELAVQYPKHSFLLNILRIQTLKGVTDLSQSIKKLLNLAHLRYINMSSFHTYDCLNRMNTNLSKDKLNLCNAIEKLIQAYTVRSLLYFLKAINEVIDKIHWENNYYTSTESQSIESILSLYCSSPYKLAFGKEVLNNYLLKTSQTLYDNESIQNQNIMLQITRYIDENYMLNLSINELAETFHISTSYFSVLFRRKTGVTFLKYITQLRLAKSRELLLNKNLTIHQIGQEVGYTSDRYFTKVFKENFGEYPSEYRKREILNSCQ